LEDLVLELKSRDTEIADDLAKQIEAQMLNAKDIGGSL